MLRGRGLSPPQPKESRETAIWQPLKYRDECHDNLVLTRG